jgi:hypothetical protein
MCIGSILAVCSGVSPDKASLIKRVLVNKLAGKSKSFSSFPKLEHQSLDKSRCPRLCTENEFHVSGALTFLENEIIHVTIRFDQRSRGEYSSAVTFQVTG